MADGNDRTDFFARLRNSLLDLSRRLECNASEDTLDFVSFRLQQMLQHLVHFGGGLDGVRQSITDVVLLLENVQGRRTRAGPQNVVAAPTGLVGRPKFDIPQEQVDYMLVYDISVSDIATALGVSKSTIKRRIREYDRQTDSLKTGLSVPDSLCTAAPSPQKKNRRGGVCREGGDCTQASLRWIIRF